VLATIGSLMAANRFAGLADRERNAAVAERLARQEASRPAKAESIANREADQSRVAAEMANTPAQAETYLAMLSEVKALRAGRHPGWRDLALANLARIASLSTPRRDLVELRTEATACLGTPDDRPAARIGFPSNHLRSPIWTRLCGPPTATQSQRPRAGIERYSSSRSRAGLMCSSG
jgi:eukaryotic-like serine/threonine-protein kinase